eukprot:CAMPEP_0197516598 /NCGR_PEP_ID=MMETSP1318-20131121/1497_1 /TAXON_ID=552666 /ORGANISM="Partenskyella glossopodia, Strain RCC365" /LENGTH=222 /DNA_ID=CAMNT_0043065467 /DNA_START=160 /DNA_END=828 /DNA_ORIENTATION=+
MALASIARGSGTLARQMRVGPHTRGHRHRISTAMAPRGTTTSRAKALCRSEAPASRRNFFGSIGGAALTVPILAGELAKPGCAPAYDGSTPTAPMEILGWEEKACPAGAPGKMRCITVTAAMNNKFKKVAQNSEVYGYVEYDDGNPALWNDDVKRIANVANIKPGDNKVTFDLQLRKLPGLTGQESVVFRKITARMYFNANYSAQPLGIVDCDEVDSADCEP